jgi:hypothetical protein
MKWPKIHFFTYRNVELLNFMNFRPQIYPSSYVTDRFSSGMRRQVLTFKILAVSLLTTRFNIQKFYMVLALRWVFCTDLGTDSEFYFMLHSLIGFYNCGGKCLLRGTDWFLILYKADYVSSCLSVRPTAWNNWAFAGRTAVWFCIGELQ